MVNLLVELGRFYHARETKGRQGEYDLRTKEDDTRLTVRIESVDSLVEVLIEDLLSVNVTLEDGRGSVKEIDLLERESSLLKQKE